MKVNIRFQKKNCISYCTAQAMAEHAAVYTYMDSNTVTIACSGGNS